MTGFIRGLFGGGNKNKQSSQSNKQAFYLEPDEAKTLGDIDYMRQAKLIKRTYAKKQGETEEKAIVTQVSALNVSQVEESKTSSSSAGGFGQTSGGLGQSSSFGQTSGGFGQAGGFGNPSLGRDTVLPRRNDTSMDMFRKMAKDVRKR